MWVTSRSKQIPFFTFSTEKMEAKASWIAISIVAITSVVIIAVQIVNWVWLRPKKLEKYLREQGFDGNPYRLLRGDMLEFAAMARDTKSKQIKLSDNVSHHALPYIHHIINKYGIYLSIYLSSILINTPE